MKSKRKERKDTVVRKLLEYDSLVRELKDIRVRFDLNGMPLTDASLYELMLIVKAVGEVELMKTHGNARVEGRMFSGSMEKRRKEARGTPQ